MPWEDTEDFVRSGHRNPEEFETDSLRTITLSEEEGIKAVIGKPRDRKTTEVVSYLFSKEKGWTLEKAKEWFSEHQEKAKESFSWAGSIKELPGASNLIRGKALHPLRTVHPEEWPEVREYLEEELQKSAHSLRGKPLILDHYQPLRGKVLGAEYEDGAIEYVARIDDPRIWNQIKKGDIEHCSVEFEWKTLENVNGVAPRGITFTGLSLLKNFEPGDPLTTVEAWEAIVKRLKEAKGPLAAKKSLGTSRNVLGKEQAEPQEFILYVFHDPTAFLPDHFSTAWIDQTNGIQGIFGRLRENTENSVPQALLFMKVNNWTLEKMQDWLHSHPQYLRPSAPAQPGIQPASGDTGVMKMGNQTGEELPKAGEPKTEKERFMAHFGIDEEAFQKLYDLLGDELFKLLPERGNKIAKDQGKAKEAEWDTEYINDLPDDAFAYIEPGGEKDGQGKTTPRSLRHLPFKNAQGNIDHDHLVNALARVKQAKTMPEGGKRAAIEKLCADVRSWNREHEDKIESDVCDVHPEEAKEQKDELTVEEIKQKIVDLTKQKEELQNKLYPESPLSEEEKKAVQARIDALYVEIEAYEQALATKVAGQAAPPRETPAKPETIGEAIIPSETLQPPVCVVPVEKIEAVMPSLQAERSMSWGAQRFVQEVKKLIHGARKGGNA